MMIFTEAGYTPANLRALMSQSGLTQAAVAELLSVSPRTVARWLAPVDGYHSDMPLSLWLSLIKSANMPIQQTGETQ